jgi:uncharacterized protein YgiM (DUF1202 family)
MEEPRAGEIYRTIRAYESAYPEPLRLESGDRVRIGVRESEWAGWLWCTDESGRNGWIPEAYIRREGPVGVMLVGYDATELTVAKGEPVEVLETQSGWALCRKADGPTGWLPLENLDSTQA